MAMIPSTPINDYLGIPPISREKAQGNIYFGSTYGYQAGAENPITITSETFIPKELTWGMYGSLPPESKALLVQIMDAKAGTRNWNDEELKKTWSEGILMSESIVSNTGQRISPLEALRNFYLNPDGSPAQASGGRSGGGGSGRSVQTRLTDPTSAEALIDKSLQGYLGRAATASEKSAFLKALNTYERENPTVSTTSGDYTVTKGGAAPAQFAEEYARSQEGAAEFQAATTYFDSFLNALGNPVG